MAASASELIYKNIIAKFFVIDRGDRENLVSKRAERVDNGVRFVLENVPNPDLSKKLKDVVRNKVQSMEITFNKKWCESKSKSREEFEEKFQKWIHLKLQLPPSIVSLNNNRMKGSTQEKKKFGDLSEQQKQRRVEELVDLGVDQLLLAATTAAKHSKRIDLAYVLKKLYNDETKATKIRELLRTENKNSKAK